MGVQDHLDAVMGRPGIVRVELDLCQQQLRQWSDRSFSLDAFSAQSLASSSLPDATIGLGKRVPGLRFVGCYLGGALQRADSLDRCASPQVHLA